MQPIIRCLTVGELQENCYLVTCPETGATAVVDPGADPAYLIARIRELHLTPACILNTHGHIDHIGSNAALAEAFPSPVLYPADDRYLLDAPDIFGLAALLEARRSPEPARWLVHGDTVEVGRLVLQVIHTPGHTPGSSCFLVGGHCLCGDTVFAGSVGRTDLPGGSHSALLRSLRERIMTLPPETRLYPGHGPDTTVGEEIASNPYFPE